MRCRPMVTGASRTHVAAPCPCTNVFVGKAQPFIAEGIARDAEWLHDRFVNHAVYGLVKGDKIAPST